MKRFLRLCSVVAIVVMLLGLTGAFAAALTGDRLVDRRSDEFVVLSVPSNVVIYAGAVVAVWTNTYAYPASDAADYRVVGIAENQVDQRAGVYDSTKTVTVRKGCFRMVNGGSFTDANIGDAAYMLDDQTVVAGATATNDCLGGYIVDVDSDGVWVKLGSENLQGALVVSSLNCSGAATIGGALAVTGASTLTGNTTVSGTLRSVGAFSTPAAAIIGGAVTASNNVSVGGTLASTGAFSTPAAAIIGGAVTASNNVTISGYSDAASYKVGGVAGQSMVVTNVPGATNIIYYSSGVATNKSLTP